MGGSGRAGTAYAAMLVLRGETAARAADRAGLTQEAQRAFLAGFAAGLEEGGDG